MELKKVFPKKFSVQSAEAASAGILLKKMRSEYFPFFVTRGCSCEFMDKGHPSSERFHLSLENILTQRPEILFMVHFYTGAIENERIQLKTTNNISWSDFKSIFPEEVDEDTVYVIEG